MYFEGTEVFEGEPMGKKIFELTVIEVVPRR